MYKQRACNTKQKQLRKADRLRIQRRRKFKSSPAHLSAKTVAELTGIFPMQSMYEQRQNDMIADMFHALGGTIAQGELDKK